MVKCIIFCFGFTVCAPPAIAVPVCPLQKYIAPMWGCWFTDHEDILQSAALSIPVKWIDHTKWYDSDEKHWKQLHIKKQNVFLPYFWFNFFG